jgi:protein TonB
VFESFKAEAGRDRALSWQRVTFIGSFVLHGVLLAAATVHSFWEVDELSPPAVQVTFIAAMTPPPPPPPPPAAAPAEKPRPKVRKPVPVEAVVQPAPVEKKEEPAPVAEAEEAESDSAEPEGQAGGQVGGVAGGVPTPPPPRPMPPPPPVNIAPSVGEAHRLSDLEDPRYRPTLPPPINRPGMIVWGVFKICVGADGHVSNVSIIKSADPLVDQDWVGKIRGWQYRPYSVDGRPVPFCHPARIVVKSAS